MRLWGGRFDNKPEDIVERFTASIAFDKRLAAYDIAASLAHVHMLAAKKIVSLDESKAIENGLKQISAEIENDTAVFDADDEDIHTAIERKLSEKIGPIAGKLHTARSRNDQAVTDLRLFLKDASLMVMEEIEAFQSTIIEIAERSTETVMPGMTHLQVAQPVSFAHHLLAYFWMLERDWRRFRCCFNHSDWSPLGAAALAGTGFPIDRKQTADELGFAHITNNSMDAVSDRDFVVLFQAMSSLLMSHLSRLAEELTIWTSSAYSFIELDDAFATGSSIMPQKKNPDIPELVRGKTGRIYGHLIGILTVLKGLPLTYNRDLQEDKEAIFDTLDNIMLALPALAGTLRTMKINSEAMLESAESGYSTATEIADYLAGKGMPFREAHNVTGQIVRYCLDNSIDKLSDLSIDEMKRFAPVIDEDVYLLLTADGSMRNRNSYGGTAPEAVAKQLEEAMIVMQKEQEGRKLMRGILKDQ